MINGYMQTSIAVLLAVFLDQLIGEPKRWHPLVGFGKAANFVERKFYPAQLCGQTKTKLRGVLAVFLLVGPCVVVAAILQSLPWLGLVSEIVLLYLAIGGKSLIAHGEQVRQALVSHDLELARRKVSLIVSRDTSRLQEEDIARAAVESILENGSDAVFAPIFWFVIGGAPAVVLYRLANTLDAMWGYKNDRYLYFGWAAARLDDILNLIPARLTALTYAVLGNWRHSLHCWREQAKTWYSPNAGPVMAAGAGSLSVLLGGTAVYYGQEKERPRLGLGRPPVATDIARAESLVNRGLFWWVVILILAGAISMAMGGAGSA